MSFRPLPIAAGLAFVLALGGPARAQVAADPVSATGKGITGGVLLGAEAVMLAEAAADVQPGWAYLVGGLAGGIGGGIGGYFVEQSDAKISLYMLAGGMALVIPTTVAVLATTRYKPAVEYTEDRGPVDEPVAEPPEPDAAPGAPPPAGSREGSRLARGAPRKHVRPAPSLVAYGEGALVLSVPPIEIRDLFTRREIAELGVRQGSEVRVPVLSLEF